ncbi:PH, RCC1 and FYVE domains-containing protein 1 [Sesamum alatum]|uniref:PH, RCC1 and FYVE domains-containing protein 1 n=1 Tax=Sesamum alatum TaxID=300844 RepID=A0AAE1YVV9_9LAMI|nr:PH, RCC1 and FYVE domains-containing protein 1 [Sesamum alatum]
MGQMEGICVTSISCGPWHSAAITSLGQLFTFGDGTFGALGHGDRCCTSVPREVEALKGQKVLRVSCGFWHTAAIVEDHTELPSCSDSLSGKLFTWGNGDEGQLGHGDTLCQLVPCRIKIPNDRNLCQVACGQSITVALTICGQVYTMGTTDCGEVRLPGKSHTLPMRRGSRVNFRPPRSRSLCIREDSSKEKKKDFFKVKQRSILSRLSSFDSFRRSTKKLCKKNQRLSSTSTPTSPLDGVEVLTRKSEFLAAELERTSDQLIEATAWVQAESQKNNSAKEAIKCQMSQLKEMAAKLPQGAFCRASGSFSDMCHALSTGST